MSRNFRDESGAFNFEGDPDEFLGYADRCLDDASYKAPEEKRVIRDPIHQAGSSYIRSAFLGEGSGKAALEACDYCRMVRPDKQLAILMFAKSIARNYQNALDIFLKKDSWIYTDVSLSSLTESPSKIDLEDFKEIAQAFYSRNQHYKKYPEHYGHEVRASNQELMYKMLFCAFSNMEESVEARMPIVASFLEENKELGVTIGGFEKRLAARWFTTGEVAVSAGDSDILFSPIVKGRDDPFLSPTPFSPMRRTSTASGTGVTSDSPYRDSPLPSFMPNPRLPSVARAGGVFYGAAFCGSGAAIGVDDDSEGEFVAARLNKGLVQKSDYRGK